MTAVLFWKGFIGLLFFTFVVLMINELTIRKGKPIPKTLNNYNDDASQLITTQQHQNASFRTMMRTAALRTCIIAAFSSIVLIVVQCIELI